MAPKPALAPIAAMATPPLRCPSQAAAALKSFADSPPTVANWPINRNSGTTDRE